MKNPLYCFLVAVLLITSCKDDEDPQSFLNGTYEIAGENTDTGIWYVGQLSFHADGTYQRVAFMRESENGETLGYTFYSKGTYTLRGEEFVQRETEMFGVNVEDYPDGYVGSLEELEEYELSTDFAEFKGRLKRINGGSKISILLECNDMLSGLSAMCIGEQVYSKVE